MAIIPDVEALYVGAVTEGLDDGTPVATKAPRDNVPQYVRLSRVGGPSPYPFLDRPMLTFECWAEDDGDAATLARRVLAIVWGLDGERVGGATITGTHETGGVAYFQDPHTPDYHRYQFTTRATIRWHLKP